MRQTRRAPPRRLEPARCLPTRHDLIILGGGLAGGLAALALRRRGPTSTSRWSSPARSAAIISGRSSTATSRRPTRALVEPLIAHRWPGYDVRFPAHRRTPRPALPHDRERSARPRRCAPRSPPTAIIRGARRRRDRRPASRSTTANRLPPAPCSTRAALAAAPRRAGLRLAEIRRPDARPSPPATASTARSSWTPRVDQADGYRFVYCLPFSPTELFVEDTYYSDTPDLDRRRARPRASRPMPPRRAGRSPRVTPRGKRRAPGRHGRRLRRLLARQPTASRAAGCAPGCSIR